jgi:hypothetical protein
MACGELTVPGLCPKLGRFLLPEDAGAVFGCGCQFGRWRWWPRCAPRALDARRGRFDRRQLEALVFRMRSRLICMQISALLCVPREPLHYHRRGIPDEYAAHLGKLPIPLGNRQLLRPVMAERPDIEELPQPTPVRKKCLGCPIGIRPGVVHTDADDAGGIGSPHEIVVYILPHRRVLFHDLVSPAFGSAQSCRATSMRAVTESSVEPLFAAADSDAPARRCSGLVGAVDTVKRRVAVLGHRVVSR